MAIKVKHEGNVTSRITAAAKGGRGKRAAEDGKAWAQIAAQEAQAGNRQLQGAHASPVSPGHTSAQLTHAPAGAAPGITHAPSGAIHGPPSRMGADTRGSGASGSRFRSGSGDAGDADLKVTGTDYFSRPDKESVWNDRTRQWMRPWLPGEWEAEAQQRVGDVKNAQQMELDESRDELARQQFEYKLSAEQKNELAKINSALEEARRSERFTPEQMAELERQAIFRRAGIKPLPVPKEEPPKPVFHTDENGQRWIQNGKGGWDPVQTPAAPQSVEDVYARTKVDEQGRRWGLDRNGKLYEVGGGVDRGAEERRKYILNAVDGIVNENNAPATPEQIDEAARRAGETWDRLFAKPKSQPAQGVGNFFAFGMPIFQPQQPAAAPENPPPTSPAPTPPAPTPSERDKKWSAFKGN